MNLLFWVPWVFVHELFDIVVGVPRDVFAWLFTSPPPTLEDR